MTCVICKSGETQPGTVTVTLLRGDTTVLIKGTPAEVCQICAEYYLDEVVARKVYIHAEGFRVPCPFRYLYAASPGAVRRLGLRLGYRLAH